jgi:hypothetical protein
VQGTWQAVEQIRGEQTDWSDLASCQIAGQTVDVRPKNTSLEWRQFLTKQTCNNTSQHITAAACCHPWIPCIVAYQTSAVCD